MADGLLVKLIIIPFADSENVQFGPPAGPPFIAQFNPETLQINNEIDYGSEEQPHGESGGEAKFKAVKPRTFSFEFLLDGTGAAGDTREVLVDVELFKATTGFSGVIHRPNFLAVNWGTFIATCVLESFSVNYKLFRPDGTPLRAVLSATFREHLPKALNELVKNLTSPDITHAHLVTEGEHLSLLSHRLYKDPRYYFHVAESNGLNTVRTIHVGSSLYFPPIE